MKVLCFDPKPKRKNKKKNVSLSRFITVALFGGHFRPFSRFGRKIKSREEKKKKKLNKNCVSIHRNKHTCDLQWRDVSRAFSYFRLSKCQNLFDFYFNSFSLFSNKCFRFEDLWRSIEQSAFKMIYFVQM